MHCSRVIRDEAAKKVKVGKPDEELAQPAYWNVPTTGGSVALGAEAGVAVLLEILYPIPGAETDDCGVTEESGGAPS